MWGGRMPLVGSRGSSTIADSPCRCQVSLVRRLSVYSSSHEVAANIAARSAAGSKGSESISPARVRNTMEVIPGRFRGPVGLAWLLLRHGCA